MTMSMNKFHIQRYIAAVVLRLQLGETPGDALAGAASEYLGPGVMCPGAGWHPIEALTQGGPEAAVCVECGRFLKTSPRV